MSPADASSRCRRGQSDRSISVAERIPADRGAAAAARRLVRARLGDLVATDTLDDVLLVVSELVTNGVLHGRGDVRLRLAFDGRCVRGDVRDDGEAFARRARERRPRRVGGQGLRVVDELTHAWGLSEESACAWFEIAAGRPAAATALT